MYNTKLVLGDHNRDGHGQTEDFYLSSNLTTSEIKSAYDIGTVIIGLDITSLNADYSDDVFISNNIDILKKAGFSFDLSERNKRMLDQGFISISTKLFTEIYLFIAQKGNSSFNYKFIQPDYINIGGYGLFSP